MTTRSWLLPLLVGAIAVAVAVALGLDFLLSIALAIAIGAGAGLLARQIERRDAR